MALSRPGRLLDAGRVQQIGMPVVASVAEYELRSTKTLLLTVAEPGRAREVLRGGG